MDRATHDRRTTRRMFSIVAVLGLVIGLVDAVAPSTQAQVPGANGRIVFSRFEKGLPNGDGGHGDLATYTVNPDGSHEQLLFPGSSHNPHWSPDGSEVAIFAPDSAGGETLSATIVNPDTGTYRQLPIPDPALPIGCTWWSPDGLRLACVGAEQSVNGIYTIRSSDGGGLQQVTSNPTGEDNLGGYSPDGKRLLFERTTAEGDEALYTVLVNGGGLKKISPATLTGFQVGSWSPLGTQIVFAARSAPDQRRSIWVVNSNGTGLQQVPIPSCGGASSERASRGCLDPGWSPDGRQIVLDILVPMTNDRHIYTVNTDGTGLFQVTNHGAGRLGEGDEAPDWGTHRLAH